MSSLSHTNEQDSIPPSTSPACERQHVRSGSRKGAGALAEPAPARKSKQQHHQQNSTTTEKTTSLTAQGVAHIGQAAPQASATGSEAGATTRARFYYERRKRISSSTSKTGGLAEGPFERVVDSATGKVPRGDADEDKVGVARDGAAEFGADASVRVQIRAWVQRFGFKV